MKLVENNITRKGDTTMEEKNKLFVDVELLDDEEVTEETLNELTNGREEGED